MPKYRDTHIYAGDKKQRKQASDNVYGMNDRIMKSDPNRYWGSNYDDWSRDSGFEGPPGGMSWAALTGGGGGRASAGRATASLVDMNDESFDPVVRAARREAFIGRTRAATEAQTDAAVRRGNTSAELSGLSPAARALMALKARTAGADTVGNAYEEFAEDAHRNALSRRAEALGGNADRGTNVSISNAQNQTSASQTNAGLGESAAGRRGAAAQFMMGLWDRNQDRDLERYQGAHNMGMDLVRPTGQKTEMASTWDNIKGAAKGAAGIASAAMGGGWGGAAKRFMSGMRRRPNYNMERGWAGGY